MRRSVRVHLEFEVLSESSVELQVAVADQPLIAAESLLIRAPGGPLTPDVVVVPGQGRVQRFTATPGSYAVDYEATVDGRAEPARVSDADAIVYLRPSRYAEADRLQAVAFAEFSGVEDPVDLLAAVSSWVGGHLIYVPGSSRPTDGAVTTMLQRSGVCRDYAHLVVALLRARNVPARLAAVYAPGLDPMDFHAVAEAAVDGVWRVVDATLLAPRSSLLRICTGRDAADTAFLSSYGGGLELRTSEVVAVVDGLLPDDDVSQLVSLG
jgi:transglutaminase-like putative cysteine protease